MYSFQKSKAVTIIGLCGVISGALIVASWLLNTPGFGTMLPNYTYVKFNSALCFILLGAALILTQFESAKHSKLFFLAFALSLTLICLLTLSEYIFHFNAGIDQLFITDRLAAPAKYPFPGRMWPQVAAAFGLSGLALLGFSVNNKLIHNLSQYAMHLVTLISGVAMISYLYSYPLSHNLEYKNPVVLFLSALLFFTTIIASLLHPSLGVTRLFSGSLVGNKMARRLFILMACVIVIFGSLKGQSIGVKLFAFDTNFSLLIIGLLLVSLVIIWYTANWLNRIDLKRYEAEEEIKVMNEELEERVEERSAELLNLLEKYRESESKFRTAFEYSAIGMALVSLEGKWLQVNRRLCEMLGYTEQELLSMTFMDVTYPDDLAESLSAKEISIASESEAYRIEKRYLCKNGTIIWASVNMATVKDNSGQPLYLVSQVEDITESKKINARFKTIVESVFVGIKLNDINGDIIYRSPSMQAINGWTDEEMNRDYFKLTHPEDLERVKKIHAEVLSNPGKTINITYRILHKNGNYIWIESLLCNKLADPALGAIITVTRDVTERKIVEDQLKKSEEKYHSLIEHASDAIYVLDFKGYFIDANKSMCKMTGYTKKELLQLNIEQLVDPEQLITDPVIHGPRESDRPIFRERRLVRKNGQIFDVEINVKTFPDDKVLVIARDISDRKRMEEELRDAELKFRTLAEKSMVGVYISQKERFTYVNPRFAEIFGYEPHELINTAESAVKIIIAEDDRAMVWKKVEARYRGEVDNAHYEVRGKTKDGKYNYVEFYGSRVLIDGEPTIIGTMLDITERKIVEELVLREKTLSETIINSLPEVFYLRNDKGEFLRWNQNFEKVTGYIPEEIRKINSRDLVAKEDQETVKKAFEKLFDEGSATVETRIISKSGIKIPFLITVTAIVYENQQCVLGIAVDISSRLKAEEELRSSEHKYKLLFESNPQPMSMIAKDDLSIIAVNETLANLYGYSKDELLKMTASVFRPKEDREQQLEIFRRDIGGSTDLGVIKHVRKDGTVMFVHIIAHDIIFEGRLVRLSLTTDVTEKLKAEEQLQKSEANLKTIMDTTDTAYALLDKKLKIITYNPMAVKFVTSQYKHVAVPGDQLIDFLPQERFPQFIKNADEALKGKNISYEIKYPQPEGSDFWYYVKLYPITNDKKEIFGLMLSISDITERKNAEESLKAAYNMIQDHINSIKEMAWKQSHLIRSPLANLKGLAALLKEDPVDSDLIKYINIELDRLDSIIIDMAEEASNHD